MKTKTVTQRRRLGQIREACSAMQNHFEFCRKCFCTILSPVVGGDTCCFFLFVVKHKASKRKKDSLHVKVPSISDKEKSNIHSGTSLASACDVDTEHSTYIPVSRLMCLNV